MVSIFPTLLFLIFGFLSMQFSGQDLWFLRSTFETPEALPYHLALFRTHITMIQNVFIIVYIFGSLKFSYQVFLSSLVLLIQLF